MSKVDNIFIRELSEMKNYRDNSTMMLQGIEIWQKGNVLPIST